MSWNGQRCWLPGTLQTLPKGSEVSVSEEPQSKEDSEADKKLSIISDWRWQFSRREEFLPAGGDCSVPDLGSALPEECSPLPCSPRPQLQGWSRGHSKNLGCFSLRNLSAWWLLLWRPQKPGARSPQQHCTFTMEQSRKSSSNPPSLGALSGEEAALACVQSVYETGGGAWQGSAVSLSMPWLWEAECTPGPSSSPGVLCTSLCSQALTPAEQRPSLSHGQGWKT